MTPEEKAERKRINRLEEKLCRDALLDPENQSTRLKVTDLTGGRPIPPDFRSIIAEDE